MEDDTITCEFEWRTEVHNGKHIPILLCDQGDFDYLFTEKKEVQEAIEFWVRYGVDAGYIDQIEFTEKMHDAV